MPSAIDWTVHAKELGYDTEKEFLEAHYPKQSITDLAKALSVSPWTVKRKLEDHGIGIRKRGGPMRRKLEVMDAALIERMRLEGAAAVARDLGVTKYTLYNRKKQYLTSCAQQATVTPSSSPEGPEEPAPHPSDLPAPQLPPHSQGE